MATNLDQTRRTLDAYAESQGKIVANLLRILLPLWLRLPSWSNRDMVRAWAARSAVDVDAALSQTRQLTRAYTLFRLDAVDARPNRLPETFDSYERGGTAITEVYQRPARERNFVERRELAAGASPEEAAEKADAAFLERIEQIVEDDVAATARDEASKVFQAAPAKVTGYRRIIHPELSKTGTCGLCIAAATRLYSIEELMPLHGGCHCTVDAVTADADPGLELNREDLDKLYAAAGSTYAEDLKNIRVRTVEHGELGPILIRKGSKFRTIDDVNRDTKYTPKATPFKRMTREDDRTNWRAMKATSERSIRYLQNAKSRGTDMVDLGTGRPTKVTDIDAAIQYHRDLIARAARHAA